MKTGYAFRLTGYSSWYVIGNDEAWETVCQYPDGDERICGTRQIDGAWCVVFHRKADGRYYAQTAVYLGVELWSK